MEQHKWYVNEVSRELICSENPSLKVELVKKNGHLYLEWSPAVILFSRSDLLKIHRRFVHSTPEKLCKLLKKAAPKQFDSNTRRLLDEISKHCQSWQQMAPKPFIFQVTMPDDI